MYASLGSTSLGLSELPGLPGSLFPLPDWGSSPSLYFQISFNFLLFFFSFWHPYDSDIGAFKVVPKVPKPLLIFLNSCFFILFWLNVSFFLLDQTIDLSPGFLPFTVGSCIFSFISLFTAFSFSSILRPYSTNSVSILITSVLNFASDRLSICLLLSCIFSGVLIYSFIWANFFFVLGTCYIVRDRALGICPGRATLIASWWCRLWGRGPRGNNAACLALSWLLVSFPATHKQIGLFQVLIPGWVGLCTF